VLAGYFNLAQREIKQIETMNDTIRHDKDGGFTVIPEKVMELKRAEQILKNQNEWLWDNTGLIPQPMTNPKELRRAIDLVVDHLIDKK